MRSKVVQCDQRISKIPDYRLFKIRILVIWRLFCL